MTCRRRPHLHPQTHAREEGASVTRRRRRTRTSPAAASSLPVGDDMLREILLRLPPQPSSLPRASVVCKSWRGIVTDPKFHRQFYAHHRKPPILGVFEHSKQGIVFNPILDPPDRIPPERFSLGRYSRSCGYDLLDCRHSLVLIKDSTRQEVVVCDPISNEQRRVAIPPELIIRFINGAVLCAIGDDQGHVHGGCHSSPFKVGLMSRCIKGNQPIACVYSSNTGIWGDLIPAETPSGISGSAAVLVGNCLYWLSMGEYILVLDLGEHSVTTIKGPPGTGNLVYRHYQIIRAEGGALGYAILSYPHIEMWQRNISGDGVATWVPWKTVEIHGILELTRQIEAWDGGKLQNILAIDGGSNGDKFLHNT